ncbi:MAG: ATP phosphoribosyltransferase regulatory subunit [Alphaproteobacteria bacterium]
MNDAANKALLPDGLRDGLPPEAEHEAAVTARLLAAFAARGYERVEPPLVEFEDSLLDATGAALALTTFRLMDPVSQRMMGLRGDITPQIARIATSRLAKAPRPLRLAYAGPVLRVRGSQLQPERQIPQVGIELIGSDETGAHVEVMLLAAEALQGVGVEGLSLDINLPTLVATVCAELGLDDSTARRARRALDRKDAAAVTAIGGQGAEILGGLLAAVGHADATLAVLDALALPTEAAAERTRLREVLAELRAAAPGLAITVDPVEHRGFEYQTGISFSLFARGVRGELGRGGRYAVGAKDEPATGFTLYLNSLVRALPPGNARPRLFLPHGTAHAVGIALRADDWITIAGLGPVADARAEARRLGCSHWLAGDKPESV